MPISRLSIRIVLAATLLGLLPRGAPAAERVFASAALAPGRFVWADPDQGASPVSAEPVTIVIARTEQRAYVWRGTVLVALSSISTGRAGKATPLGTYRILQKRRVHRSNLYDDAAMPYMQRLTWDGIAIHAGRNPGFPASHGCVRLPTEFARRLFDVTGLGTVVVVVDTLPDPILADPILADPILPDPTLDLPMPGSRDRDGPFLPDPVLL